VKGGDKMKKLILLMLLLPISLIGCTDEESSVTVGHTTVYYTNVPDAKAEVLAGYLQEEFGFTSDTDILLSMSGNEYEVRIPSSYSSPSEVEESFKVYFALLASRVSEEVFFGSPVKLVLVTHQNDELFAVKNQYSFEKAGRVFVYFKGVDREQAFNLANYLESLVGENYDWDVIFEQSEGVYHVVPFVGINDASELTPEMENSYQSMATELEDVLGGDVVVHLVNFEGYEVAAFEG